MKLTHYILSAFWSIWVSGGAVWFNAVMQKNGPKDRVVNFPSLTIDETFKEFVWNLGTQGWPIFFFLIKATHTLWNRWDAMALHHDLCPVPPSSTPLLHKIKIVPNTNIPHRSYGSWNFQNDIVWNFELGEKILALGSKNYLADFFC